MDKPWKLILLLAGIFIAGVVAGGLGTIGWGHRLWRERPQQEWPERRMGVLVERLDLTPAQMEKVRPILRRGFQELNQLRFQALTDSRAVVKRMEQDVADVLTPEQRDKYEQMKNESRERFRKLLQNREHERGMNRQPGTGGPRPRSGFPPPGSPDRPAAPPARPEPPSPEGD